MNTKTKIAIVILVILIIAGITYKLLKKTPENLGAGFIPTNPRVYGSIPPNNNSQWLTATFGGAESVSSTFAIIGLDSLSLNLAIAPSTTTSTVQYLVQYSDDVEPTTDGNWTNWFFESPIATTTSGYSTSTNYFVLNNDVNKLVHSVAVNNTSLTVTNATTTIANLNVDGTHKWVRFLWRYLSGTSGHRGSGGRIYINYLGKESVR